MFSADGILNVVVIELLAGFVTKFECIAMIIGCRVTVILGDVGRIAMV